MTNNEIIEIQKNICLKYNAEYFPSDVNFKVGISKNVKDKIMPINGLRHPGKGDTTGWYIWADEYSNDPDFFVPLHIEHIPGWSLLVSKYLDFLLVTGFKLTTKDVKTFGSMKNC